jgi:glucosylceramidase
MKDKILIYCLVMFLLFFSGNCNKNSNQRNVVPPASLQNVETWLTTADQSSLLQKGTVPLYAGNPSNTYPSIFLDSTMVYQSIDGFGYTITGGSAYLINHMDAAAKNNLLNELFGSENTALHISFIRLSIGSSDLNPAVFSYDDIPAGQTDLSLSHFNLAADTTDLVPVLKQILNINPALKILASPWSAPVWMKDNASSIGGTLQAQYYNVYANYFVKYIQQMQANGIPIYAVTIQNEPQFGGNNPSMVLSSVQEADFIRNNLGPAFQSAALNTRIIVWDHNCDNPNYPIDILNDAAARPYVDGSAFHLYNGNISALSLVHNAYPQKNLYFTEQWTGATASFSGDFQWHLRNVIIGSLKNWSRVALEWNLASDPACSIHTTGGCTECKGGVTINGSTVTRNVGYYIVAHASKFVTPGSRRISSTDIINTTNVAVLAPDGKKILLLLNDSPIVVSFNVSLNNRYFTATLPANSAGTFVWN